MMIVLACAWLTFPFRAIIIISHESILHQEPSPPSSPGWLSRCLITSFFLSFRVYRYAMQDISMAIISFFFPIERNPLIHFIILYSLTAMPAPSRQSYGM